MEIGNPANPEITQSVEFLIDSGAFYTVVPTPILEPLGIKPIAEQAFRLSDGSSVIRRKGAAFIRYGERVSGADVIFGATGDVALVGSLTLTAIGLYLDPLRRELKPLPMILALSKSR